MSRIIKVLILILSSFSSLIMGQDVTFFTDDIMARILSLEERDSQQQLFNDKLSDVVNKQKGDLEQKDAIIKRLQAEVHDLQIKVTGLEMKINVLQEQCDNKQDTNKEAGLPNDELRSVLRDVFEADTGIKHNLNHNADKIHNDTIPTHNQSSKTKVFTGNIRRHSSNLNNPLDARNMIHSLSKSAVIDLVAFHAVYEGNNDILDLHADKTIQFQTVLLNVGNGYNNQQGIFTAPVNGLYLFSVSIFTLSTHLQGIEVSLMKNSQVLAAVFADGDTLSHDQGSVTVVVHLNAGDEVRARNKYPMSSLHGERCTSFTGYMIVAL